MPLHLFHQAETRMPHELSDNAVANRPSGVEAILAQRQTTHGDYTDNAQIIQALKTKVHHTRNWPTMTDVQREALDMILLKIGRICTGNPNVHDHWDDIAGYAKLVSDRIPDTK